MAKIDAATQEVLRQVPGVLRALRAENVKLASALEQYKKREEAEELVGMMDARGLADPSTPFKKKVANLLASEKDLGVLREAIGLTAPDMSFASMSEAPGMGEEDLESYILNG